MSSALTSSGADGVHRYPLSARMTTAVLNARGIRFAWSLADKSYGMAARRLWPWGVLAVLVIVAVGLRVWDLSSRPLWVDEAFTLQGVEHGVVRIATWRHHKEHPPLSYLAVWVSTHALGSTSPLALRLPAMLAGVGCVVAAYVAARRFVPVVGALLAAALIALDFQMIDQSMQARMYSLYVLLLLLTLAWMLHLLALPQRRAWHWMLLGVGLFACLATSGLALVTSVAIPLGLLCWHWRAKAAASPAIDASSANDTSPAMRAPAIPPDFARGLTLAVVTAAALNLLGWLRLFLRITRGGPGSQRETPDLARILPEFSAALADALQPTPYALAVLVLGVAGLITLLRRRHPMGYVLGSIVLLNALMVLLMRTDYGALRGRYFIPLQVSLILATAVAVSAVRLRAARAGLIAALIALGAWSAVSSFGIPADGRYAFARQVIRVRPQVQPGEWVVYEPYWEDPLATFHGLPPTLPMLITERQEPVTLPADVPGLWVTMHTSHSGGLPRHLQIAEAFCAHFGVSLDTAEFRRLHAAHVILTLHITPAGVSMLAGD
jgi:hypothetical protein